MLKNKVCLITGGTRGIGKAIARLFSNNHAVVYVTGRTDSTVEWIHRWNENKCNKIFYLNFNVIDEKGALEAIKIIKRNSSRLDVLVNNAGIEYNESIGMISLQHAEEMLKINVLGTVNMLQLACRLMFRQANGGSIINISSVVGVQGNPGQLVYSASKGAIISLTKTAAKELAAKNIRVNSIAPGLTKTEMISKTNEDFIKKRISKIALGRIAEPDDIAQACLFLASDNSSYITGQILGVDGCTSL